MSWVNDLASGLGVPAGAATLAVAMYTACSAAEKAARPEALRDIGRVLKDPSWSRSARPSAIIERVFIWTFGERHFSWHCFGQSASASFMMCVFLILTLHVAAGIEILLIFSLKIALFSSPALPQDLTILRPTLQQAFLQISLGFVLMALLPDYLSLLKARVLLRLIRGIAGVEGMAVFTIVDVTTSALISFAFTCITFGIAEHLLSSYPGGVGLAQYSYSTGAATDIEIAHRLVEVSSYDHPNIIELFSIILHGMTEPFLKIHSSPSLLPVFLFSTLFTSVWTAVTVISVATLKLLSPLHHFTAWFFDVDKHPVKALGIVAAALVMLLSLVWSMLRAVI